MKESKFSKDFLKELPNTWKLKIVGSERQVNSIPDYLLCVNGKFLAIEFKVQRDNKVSITPGQIKELNRIRDEGKGIALIIAYDENTHEILIRNENLSPKIAMGNKYISIKWNYVFDSYLKAISMIKLFLGELNCV